MRTCTIDIILATILLLLYISFGVSMLYYAEPNTIVDEAILQQLNTNGKYQYASLFSILFVALMWISYKTTDLYVRTILIIGEQISLLFAWQKISGDMLFDMDISQVFLLILTGLISVITMFFKQKIKLYFNAIYNIKLFNFKK